MLSISVISNAAGVASYYEKESGEKNYWSKDAGESTSWQGEGAKMLGLHGAVNPQDFQKIMEGKLPNGEQMPSGAGGERRSGYDLTFSAPKSVSLVGVVGEDERVLEAHDRAVKEALKYIEEEAAQTRIKENGEIRFEKTANFTAAVFRHETSRAFDPQLHSHAVVANITIDQNGNERALSSEEIFKHKMAAGAIYKAELGHNLRMYGYNLRQTKDGFEIKEIEDKHIEGFSTRRKEIEAQLRAEDKTGAKNAEMAALKTRAAKQVLTEDETKLKRETWQQTAQNMGMKDKKSLENLTSRARASWHHDTGDGKASIEARDEKLAQAQNAASDAVKHAVSHLSERQSVFEKREIIQHAAKFGAAAGASKQMLSKQIDQQIKSLELIKAGNRLTTREALQRELRITKIEAHARGNVQPIASAERVAELSKDLTQGQAQALKLSLTTQNRIVGIEGKAGAGKTYMLKKVVKEAQQQGFEVKGLAPSAQAAKVLENETGAKSETISKAVSNPPENGKQQLWVVDEAGMVSAKQADKLLKQAESVNARVIFVGDRQQLSAIEAGKPFALLVDKGMHTARMDEIMRQKNKELKAVVEKLAQGKTKQAIQDLSKSISEVKDPQKRLQVVASKYLEQTPQEREKSMVIVSTNKERHDLNTQIREGLKKEGVLTGKPQEVQTLNKNAFTQAEARQAHNYEAGMKVRFHREYKSLGVNKNETLTVEKTENNKVQLISQDGKKVKWDPSKQAKVESYQVQKTELQAGDQIRFTRNEYELNRINGHTAEIQAINEKERTALIKMENGEKQTLSLDNEREQTYTHSYASTVHASQGATADKAFIAVDSEQSMLNQQSAYVSISRAREGVEIVADEKEKVAEMAEREAGQESAVEVIQDAGHEAESSLEQSYWEQEQEQEMSVEAEAEVEQEQEQEMEM